MRTGTDVTAGQVELLIVLCAALLLVSPSRADEPPSRADQFGLVKTGKGTALTVQQVRDLAGDGFWRPYRRNPVLECGPVGDFDHAALGTPAVIKVGDVYHMYYETWQDPGDPHAEVKPGRFGGRISYDRPRGDYATLHIGHAISRDGVRWVKDPENPVLPRGPEGEWDHDGTWDPFVIFEDDIFKMWYGAGVKGTCDWAHAESTDGTHFEKKGRISHLGKVADQHVVHDSTSGKYLMYYWDRGREPGGGLLVAVSEDEMNFDFDDARPILIEDEVYLDHKNSRFKFTHVLQENGRWYMFYAKCTRPHAWDAITSLAVSNDGFHWKSVNRNLLPGLDAEVVKAADDLYLMYYGPLGYFDAMGCDIRLAVFQGKLDDMIIPTD